MKNWIKPLSKSKTEQDGTIELMLEMPGVEQEDLGVEVDGYTLTISGERKPLDAQYLLRERQSGSFYQSYTLGRQIDSEKIQANLEDGILTLRLPVREQAKPRKIPVLT